jgi:Tfp pilus assembly protein PilN
MDLNKEIKLSDLFRRSPKPKTDGEPAFEPPTGPKSEKPPKEPRLRRERRPKGERKPKRERRPKRERVEAAPTPQTPLMRAFNLLPKEDERVRKDGRFKASYAAVAAAGLLAFAALAAFYLSASASATDKENTVNDLRSQLADLEVPSKQPRLAQAAPQLAQEQQSRTAALATALNDRVAWDRLLREIALVLPGDVSLTQLTSEAPTSVDATAPAQQQATIVGTTDNHEEVAQVLVRLSAIPEFATVDLVSSERARLDDGRTVTQFNVLATLKPNGSAGA